MLTIRKYGMPVAVALSVLLFAGCEADVEEEGEMPDIDVSSEGGQLPEYEIEKTQEGEMPDVDVDAEAGKLPEVDVEGPDVDVEKKEVEVPTLDIDPPKDDEN